MRAKDAVNAYHCGTSKEGEEPRTDAVDVWTGRTTSFLSFITRRIAAARKRRFPCVTYSALCVWPKRSQQEPQWEGLIRTYLVGTHQKWTQRELHAIFMVEHTKCWL